MNKDGASKMNVQTRVVSGTTILDTQGAESGTFLLPVINTTSVALQDGDDSGLSDAADVAEAFIVVGDAGGTLSGNDVAYAATGNGVIGYVGKKRYVQVTVTNAVASSSIMFVKGDLHKSPDPSA